MQVTKQLPVLPATCRTGKYAVCGRDNRDNMYGSGVLVWVYTLEDARIAKEFFVKEGVRRVRWERNENYNPSTELL